MIIFYISENQCFNIVFSLIWQQKKTKKIIFIMYFLLNISSQRDQYYTKTFIDI